MLPSEKAAERPDSSTSDSTREGFALTVTTVATVAEESKMSETTLESLTLFLSEDRPAGRVESTNARTLEAARVMPAPESDRL
jgi:hypothetical protein